MTRGVPERVGPFSSIRSLAASKGTIQPFNHQNGITWLFAVVAIKIKVLAYMGNSKKLTPCLTSLLIWSFIWSEPWSGFHLFFFHSLNQNSAQGKNIPNEHFPPLSLDIKNSSTSPTSQAGLSLPLRTPPAVEKFIKFYDLPKSVLLISLTKATNLANHHVCH